MISFLLGALLARQAATPFVRSTTSAAGIVTLETSAHKLVAEGKPDVWIVGVAHVGQKKYYNDIQTLLDSQDMVLFEGVRDEKAPKPSFKPATDPNGPKPIYQILSDAIGLDFQLSDVSYDHKNWVNSDVTWQQMQELNKKYANGKSNDVDMVQQLLDPTSATAKTFAGFLEQASPGTREAIKLMIVQSLGDVPKTGFGSQAFDAVIIKERNTVVEQYFAKAIGSSNAPKSIAIFYGAGHGAGLAEDLGKQYGYRDVEQRWFTAATGDKNKVDATGKMLLSQIEALKNVKQPVGNH